MFSKKRNCFGLKIPILFLLTILLYPNVIQAQQNADSIRHTRLNAVIVTASKPRFSITSSMPMQSLSGKNLERLNSYSVADAIRYFSGVQLKDYGGVGGLKTVNVRSLGSAHTAVFYDGMSVGNAQNGQVDLGKFSLDNIEEIQLYNGQKSTIFQPARGFFASNTLFLKSKTPSFTANKSYSVKANLKTGSFGLIAPSFLYQQKISSKLSLSASTEWLKADGKYKYRYLKEGGYDTTAIRQNGDIKALHSEINLFLHSKENGQALIKAYLYDSERGLPGAIVANRYSHSQRQWDRNIFIHASFQKPVSDKIELLANLKYSDDYNRYIDPEYTSLDGALDNRYYQKEFYGSLVSQYNINPWWNMALASDLSMNTLDANLYRFPYPTRYSFLEALSSNIKKKRFDLQASILACYIDEQVKEYQKGDSRKVFCPVISISYQPLNSKFFRMRAFYKESFRMPTFNDLYYTFVGNSSLRPEYTSQYDLGVTWIKESKGLLKTLSIQGDVYYNRVKDKIVALPSSNLFRWTMMNLGVVETKGLEVNTQADIQITQQVQFNLGCSYTYQKAIDITPDGTTYGEQIPYTPIHSGTATASIQWKQWLLNYSFIYTGERYSQKANIPVNHVQPWYTTDVAINSQGKLIDQHMRVGVEINNLLNQYYDVIKNFPMPGRSFRFTVSITL